MAGVQVVLHEPDAGKESRKNETRNLGLQSIVHRENTLSKMVVNQVSTQEKLLTQINGLVDSLRNLITTYTLTSNDIYRIMFTAYSTNQTLTQKFLTIQQEALEMMQ